MSINRQHFAIVEDSTALSEPIATTDVYANSRIDSTGESVLISGLISAARQYVENCTHRALTQQNLTLHLDRFPAGRRWIAVPRPPLTGVQCIRYTDASNSTTEIDSTSIIVDTASEPGRIGLVEDLSWPSVRNILNPITIQYSAGYGTADDVPQSLKQAMLLLVGHWYENREGTITGAISKELEFSVNTLIGSYKFGDHY